MHMSSVKLRSGQGSTGALAQFLSENAKAIGQSHHLVWSLFGDQLEQRKFLYRMTDDAPTKPILIYSEVPVSDPHNLWDIQTRPFDLAGSLKVGDRLSWQIRVNATTRLTVSKKRVDIVTHERVPGEARSWDEVAQLVVPPWLEAKLVKGGLQAASTDMRVISYRKQRFSHDARRFSPAMTVAMTDLHGVGVVTNPEALQKLLLDGVGAAKGYGCGMLLVRQLR
jgi:CRISPR system Cascade subunit CasE